MTSLLPPRWRSKGSGALRELLDNLRTKHRLALLPVTRAAIRLDIGDVEAELKRRANQAVIL